MLKLTVVQAQFGDCFLLQSSGGGKSAQVLIDGGTSQTFERYLKPTLEALSNKERRLDLVVLSHIDNDHVLGLLDLFEDIKKSRESKKDEIIEIETLWHNSFNDIVGENSNNDSLITDQFLSKQFSGITLKSNKMDLPVIGALKGVGEGRDLRKLAQSLHIPINEQFGGDLIVAKEKYKNIKVGNIKFSILGPTQKNLDKLRKIWDDWLRKYNVPSIKASDLQALQALDTSVANLSSIMFIAESEGKKILFAGDGLGDDAVDILTEEGLLNSGSRYHVDVMKVPHHGSERNVSPEFFNVVTADTYVISANGRDDNPSLLTLKWIIESGKKYHRKVTIAATNKTENIEKVQQIYDAKKFQYEFMILDPQARFLELNTRNNFIIK